MAPPLTLLSVQDLVTAYPRRLQHPSEVFHFVARTYGGVGPAALVAVAVSFGAAWLLVPMGWSRLDSRSKSWALVAAGSLPVLLIATGWGRLLAPSFLLVAIAAVRAPVRTWGLYAVAALTALTSLSPDNVPLAATTLVLGVGTVLAARRGADAHADSHAPMSSHNV